MGDENWIIEREGRHRADILRCEAEWREQIYRLRWADLGFILRVPNEKATIIQCAWRSSKARSVAAEKRAMKIMKVCAVCYMVEMGIEMETGH